MSGALAEGDPKSSTIPLLLDLCVNDKETSGPNCICQSVPTGTMRRLLIQLSRYRQLGMALVLKDRFSFLVLPSEIQNKIHRYSCQSHVSKQTYFKCHLQFLLLCMSRQVRTEAEYIFRNYNLFVLVKINHDVSSVFDTLIRPIILTWYDRA